MLDDRSKLLLKTLVERYIADGQPVGSRTLARAAGMELSPATIRNVMSDLEELGLIASPHTSAGRIPTAKGYRLFVDTMLTVRREEIAGAESMGATGLEAGGQPQRVISHAAQMLSSLSQYVGVVMAPRRASVSSNNASNPHTSASSGISSARRSVHGWAAGASIISAATGWRSARPACCCSSPPPSRCSCRPRASG